MKSNVESFGLKTEFHLYVQVYLPHIYILLVLYHIQSSSNEAKLSLLPSSKYCLEIYHRRDNSIYLNKIIKKHIQAQSQLSHTIIQPLMYLQSNFKAIFTNTNHVNIKSQLLSLP